MPPVYPCPLQPAGMLGAIACWAMALIFGAYALPHVIVAWFYRTKDLKKAYNAEWALVTGASSGEQREGGGQRAAIRRRRRCKTEPRQTALPPPSPLQASASRLPPSWRARA